MCSHVCGQAVLSMHVEEKDLVFRRTRCPWSINQNPVNNVWRWAGSGRVRPIINIHYLSRPRLKQAWMYIHINRQTLCRQASGNEEWHQCENEINRPSLSFVMKCLSCSFIWWSAQPNQTSNSAGVGGQCGWYGGVIVNCKPKFHPGVADTRQKRFKTKRSRVGFRSSVWQRRSWRLGEKNQKKPNGLWQSIAGGSRY